MGRGEEGAVDGGDGRGDGAQREEELDEGLVDGGWGFALKLREVSLGVVEGVGGEGKDLNAFLGGQATDVPVPDLGVGLDVAFERQARGAPFLKQEGELLRGRALDHEEPGTHLPQVAVQVLRVGRWFGGCVWLTGHSRMPAFMHPPTHLPTLRTWMVCSMKRYRSAPNLAGWAKWGSRMKTG